MGWTYPPRATRADVVGELTPHERRREDGGVFRTLAHCRHDDVLYALHESTSPDGATTRWIAVAMLHRGTDGWGYKAMDESMHPFLYDCPVPYVLAATDPVNENAARWRAEVLRRARAIRVARSWPSTGPTRMTDPTRHGEGS